MKPRAFDYIAATSLDHALAVLADAGGDAKILAGGQSLMPMMNFRLVSPAIVVDINRIPGLDTVIEHASRLTIGALVRHRTTATHPLIASHFPMLAEAMAHVAHHTIRNRGTFVGSLCHGDPAAEMPMLALLLDATIHIAAATGTRALAARDFFQAPLVTALQPEEIVTTVDLPFLPAGAGWGFHESARRPGDFALAAAAAIIAGTDVRIALTGVSSTPIRVPEAETILSGGDRGRLPTAIDAVRSAVDPNTDIHASADFRRHLAGVLTARAVTDAWERAR